MHDHAAPIIWAQQAKVIRQRIATDTAALAALLQNTFKVDDVVTYYHGRVPRSAVVVQCHESLPRIQVRSLPAKSHRKVYWLDYTRLLPPS
jgi:hypothetical protein